jgi:hypothetical protein
MPRISLRQYPIVEPPIMIKWVDDAWCRKTLLFLSFTTYQGTSIRKEAIAFRELPFPNAILIHQSLTVVSLSQSEVSLSWSPNQGMAFQIWWENRHFKRRWDADSWIWLQRGQFSQFGQTLLDNRSTVQIMSYKTNQAKYYIWEVLKIFK